MASLIQGTKPAFTPHVRRLTKGALLSAILRWVLVVFFHRLRTGMVTLGTKNNFLLAIKVHTCHNWSTARRGHAVGKFRKAIALEVLVFGKHKPNSDKK